MLMELDRFWKIIDLSRSGFDPSRARGNMATQLERFETILSELPPKQLGAFYNRFIELFHVAYHWDLWAAAYIVEGGCSDDSFMDFRYWLISMGRAVFENALLDAESLADVVFTQGVEYTEFEQFGYIPNQVMDRRGISEKDAELMAFAHPDSPAGDAWTDEDLANRFPRLTAAAALHGA